MKRINIGITGSKLQAPEQCWEDLTLPSPWSEVIQILSPGTRPRSLQARALTNHDLLRSRRNLIVVAPTNSGKSLIGLLPLLETVSRGRRAVLLEPLRAIAREKADELTEIGEKLSSVLGRKLTVRITTGDYRLDDEDFATPPPENGELIIVTPERLDAILRNPDNNAWVESIGAVCVDEAHLISSPRRGPVLEYLLTTLLCQSDPPRLILLSASLGDVTQAQQWLAPCDVLSCTDRHPPLEREVWSFEEGEDMEQALVSFVQDTIACSEQSVLLFVYQTRTAERLAAMLDNRLALDGDRGMVLAYHAQMSRARREEVRTLYRSQGCRCLVTTTALGMGVNLPTSHAIVWESTFPGQGRLSVADLMQMMGRAGRGDRPGYAAVAVRAKDAWPATELAETLRQEVLPALVSTYRASGAARWSEADLTSIEPTASRVAAHLVRSPDTGITGQGLQTFFTRSLGGAVLAANVPSAVQWLTDPCRCLAYIDEFGYIRLTALGTYASRALLPLPVAAGYGQLLRDVMTIDPMDRLMATWRPLDHLILIHLLHDSLPALRPFSAKLADQVDGWMERHPSDVPMLFREWIQGQTGSSRSAELLGSLGVTRKQGGQHNPEEARKSAYLAAFRAIVLFERGHGKSTGEVARIWTVSTLEGVEERWRDDVLWLLSGLSQCLELRSFYFHLREGCVSDDERVFRVKRQLRTLRRQTLQLMGELQYCSPLGALLFQMRGAQIRTHGQNVGSQTIRRLEEAGVTSIAELVPMTVEDLMRIGIRPRFAQHIHNHMIRRRQ